MVTFALLFLAMPPKGPILIDRCDLIEVNHVYDPSSGRQILSQFIFWDWIPSQRRFRVVDWRMLPADFVLQREDLGWLLLWHDGGDFRKCSSHSFLESYTPIDIELAERRVWPQNKRRRLLQPGGIWQWEKQER